MKNKYLFTEGEWIQGKFLDVICVENKGTICNTENDDRELIECKANARLISCAPEMLKLLYNIVDKLIKASMKITNFSYNECVEILRKSPDAEYINIIEKSTGKKWEEII